jgi:uncharacterized protein YicC (UPF0701 family)
MKTDEGKKMLRIISEAWQRLEKKIHFIEAKQTELYTPSEEEIREREANAKKLADEMDFLL